MSPNSLAVPPGIDASSVDAVIAQRRSARAFLPQPVPRELLEPLLQVAARAHGLDSCPQGAWNDFQRIVMPHVGMALGYADPAAQVNELLTPRVVVESFTTWLD